MKKPYSLGFWTVGIQFLRLVKASTTELVDSGNPHVIFSDSEVGRDRYDYITRWADHNVAIPILFNFYHGIELILKGFISLNKPPPSSHNITCLLNEAGDSTSRPNEFFDFIDTFVSKIPKDSLLREFTEINSISIDSWYEALKYPISRQGQEFHHYPLKYGGEGTISFWRDIENACDYIIRESEALATKLGS